MPLLLLLLERAMMKSCSLPLSLPGVHGHVSPSPSSVEHTSCYCVHVFSYLKASLTLAVVEVLEALLLL